jgi:hypothetical protein
MVKKNVVKVLDATNFVSYLSRHETRTPPHPYDPRLGNGPTGRAAAWRNGASIYLLRNEDVMEASSIIHWPPHENPYYESEREDDRDLRARYEHHARLVSELNALAGKAGLHGDYLTADSLMDAVDRHNAKCKALRHELDDLEAGW